ncbi:hypothetical protein N566_23405 [Streptomycetaceae bacterium MP113-05]|nr:hypothetical protein N566_23405 [Streptomycetaceae bacterium MP113-05]
MISASVGYQCPECVRGGSGTGHRPDANRPRTLAGGAVTADPWLITKVLLGVNIAVFLAILAVGRPLTDELLLFGRAATGPYGPVEGVAEGQWYRLLTSAFAHQEFWHIGMNMLALWVLGPQIEGALGRARFIALYLLSALGGSVLAYVLADPQQASLGASGAIYGLFGAMAVLVKRLKYDMRPIFILLALNLFFTFAPWSGFSISWEAHVGGLVAGAVIAWAMVYAPRERRALVQYGACGAVLALELVACVVRTMTLTG